jgi:hypothetical protein
MKYPSVPHLALNINDGHTYYVLVVSYIRRRTLRLFRASTASPKQQPRALSRRELFFGAMVLRPLDLPEKRGLQGFRASCSSESNLTIYSTLLLCIGRFPPPQTGPLATSDGKQALSIVRDWPCPAYSIVTTLGAVLMTEPGIPVWKAWMVPSMG